MSALNSIYFFLAFVPLLALGSPRLEDRNVLGGTIGLGDIADQAYLVSATIGNSTVTLQLDTYHADLLVISDACQAAACAAVSGQRYTPSASFVKLYDDAPFLQPGVGIEDVSEGRVGRDTVTIAGLTMDSQVIGVVDNINATSPLWQRAVGNLGLGFPLASILEDYAITVAKGVDITEVTYDWVIGNTSDSGPVIPRLSQTGAIERPMFSITLQRDTVDVSGAGQLTIGELPAGIDNASITWVPVRLYDLTQDPDQAPPSAPNEKAYPFFWEVPLDAIFLDGEKLTQSPSAGNVTALISTSTPYVNGSADVVTALLNKVSSRTLPTLPCDTPHNLTFQIGGKLFPVDPRDFASQAAPGDAKTCVANVGPTDGSADDTVALWTWVLGTPFLKSNLAAFYYGNLTHPSVDPPRVGLMSLVPQNASALLGDAVKEAQSAGGSLESTTQAAPTASSLITGVPTATIPGRKPSVASASPSGSANAAASPRFAAFTGGTLGITPCVMLALLSLSVCML
ncbi:acid protease [Polyporus arcularius HHB13444]|uniref:Acid protease n=1 Tax=Polyporus arcularius HHB13444 TaxID=1314778 RepID=A0A5C3PBD5_9APHY|nr:acid protease [Polyporus arcularius HHB13444]